MKYIAQIKNILVAVIRLPQHIETIGEEINSLKRNAKNLGEQEDEFKKHLTALDDRLSSTSSVVENMSISAQKETASSNEERFADNHSLDKFYLDFENRFRGSEEDVEENAGIYAEFFNTLDVDFDTYPVVDLGCGRGELLSAFGKAGVRIIGLDINYNMVEQARENGHEAEQGDALSYLQGLEKNSVGGITGVHLVEHIPFPELLAILKECYRVMTPGGAVAFETPNPENLVVGIYGFYMDPSHLHPLPSPLLTFSLEQAGFVDADVWHLHPSDRERPSYDDELLQELANRVYGPFDYAAIGRKPSQDIAREY